MLNRLIKNKERGSAIISALFLMGIVAMLSVAMITRQNVEIRRTETMFQEERLLAQAAYVEFWAIDVLRNVLAEMEHQDQKYFDLTQKWAKPLEEFHREGVWVSGEIIDLQSQFNINNLLAEVEASKSTQQTTEKIQASQNNQTSSTTPAASQQNQTPYTTGATQQNQNKTEEKNPFDKDTPYTLPWMFARLITNVSKLSTNEAQATTENIIHWMKPEETDWDKEYSAISPPYRPGHQLLQSLSELRLILHVNNDMINAIQPYTNAYISRNVQDISMISSSTKENIKENVKQNIKQKANLPGQQSQGSTSAAPSVPAEVYELFPINVNTTTPQVLAAVMNIDVPKATSLLSNRPYHDTETLQQELSTLNLKEESTHAQNMLSTTSHYFLIKAKVRDDRRSLVQYSIVKINEEYNLVVIRRVQGEL